MATVALAEEAAELLPPKAEIARRRHGRQYGQIASGHKSACNFIASRRTACPLTPPSRLRPKAPDPGTPPRPGSPDAIRNATEGPSSCAAVIVPNVIAAVMLHAGRPRQNLRC
jgi:hypothetical protein